MTQTNIDTSLFAKLDEYIDGLHSKQGALIPVLHEAQRIFEFLPIEVQNYIAQKLDIPASKIYGVVTFYSFFTMTKKGKYKVSVCMGTPCFVRGADKVLAKFEKDLGVKAGTTSEDGMYSVDALRCVGACGLAPVVIVNGKVYGRIETDKDVEGVISDFTAGEGAST
ncbi:MAG: NAD(P)H-dependent oxidoreductase subunit E [Defluviitaleaceae bacterium]|nr:NAD(P)H-dependent oxidoreductase subunit E [Defluviitaleaceae bacterium]